MMPADRPHLRYRRRFALLAPPLLPLLLGWAPAAFAQASADELRREALSIFENCQRMALGHVEVLTRAQLMSRGGQEEGLETLAAEAERVYIATIQGGLDEASNRISRLESEMRNVPPESVASIPMASVTGMCQLASQPVGGGGLDQLRLDIASYTQSYASSKVAFGSRGGASSGGAAGGPDAAPVKIEQRVRPNERPLTPAEFEERKRKWEARQHEDERRQQEELRLRQEALEAKTAAAAAAPPPDAKVTVRKELLPPGTQKTAEQVAFTEPMKAWHKTYSDAVKPFKNSLSQVLAIPPTRAYARREACKNLWVAVSALNQSTALKSSPDPAVAAPAVAMGGKFLGAADACLAGKSQDMDKLMKEAEAEIGKMAAALSPYGLTP